MRKLLIVLALACMGRRWEIRVPLEGDDQARIVELAATMSPTLQGGGATLQPLTSSETWPGKVTYFVPAGAGAIAHIGGRCPSCSSCDAPDGAFLRITSVEQIASWRLDASSEPHDVLLDPDKEQRTTFAWAVSGTAVHTEPRFRVEGGSGLLRDTVQGFANERMTFWERVYTRKVATVRAHLSIEGPCPSKAPCQPPPDAKLAFTRIVTDTIAPPQ